MSNVMDIIGYLGTGVGTLVGVGGGILGLVYMAKMTKSLTSEVSAITQSFAPNMELLTNGELAEATVVAAEETGLRLQGVPVLRLILDVRRTMGAAYRPDQQAFRIETKAMVPDLKFAQIQPGSLVAVRLDPRDLSKLALALR